MEEIKKALEGVTPGPWFEGDKWVFVSPRSGLMDEALENVLRNDEAQANARYIAAVNPAAISDLLSTLKSLQRENERLERERAKQWRRARRADASRDTYSALAKTFEAEANQLREVATANRQRAEAAEYDTRELLISFETVVRLAEQGILSMDGGQASVDIRSLIPVRLRTALASTGGEHNAE